MTLILYIIFSYLIGSIPFAIIFGRLFKKIDIRDFGSKNAGATNAFRVLGWKLGTPVLTLDLLKGFIPVFTLRYIFPNGINILNLSQLEIVITLALVLGHIYPIWASFKGGKGVATGAGAITAIFPPAFIICISIFTILALISKYISVASIFSALSLPFVYIIYNNITSVPTDKVIAIFFSVIAIIITLKHLRNIKRIIKGTESRINIIKK